MMKMICVEQVVGLCLCLAGSVNDETLLFVVQFILNQQSIQCSPDIVNIINPSDTDRMTIAHDLA